LNRTTPRTQAALLEAMQEQQVTIERETHPLERPFIVIASQAPYGGAGTSPMTDVQIDRFMFRIWSGFPSMEEEHKILRNIDQITETKVTPVATLADIIALQQTAKKVHVADSISRYIIEIIDRLRKHQEVLVGPSPRGGIALFRGARALAFVRGRDFVIPDDVKGLLVPSLSHRLLITAEAEMDKVTPEAVITAVAQEVIAPGGKATSQTKAPEPVRAVDGIRAADDETASQLETTGEVEYTTDNALPTQLKSAPNDTQKVPLSNIHPSDISNESNLALIISVVSVIWFLSCLGLLMGIYR
jgi:Mg-chelatase subunit ChlI